jgi:hypothetical protein
MNLTALTPHLFFSKILIQGVFILISQTLTVASFEPLAIMFPSKLKTSRANTSF